jgi:hypothetical protein
MQNVLVSQARQQYHLAKGAFPRSARLSDLLHRNLLACALVVAEIHGAVRSLSKLLARNQVGRELYVIGFEICLPHGTADL